MFLSLLELGLGQSSTPPRMTFSRFTPFGTESTDRYRTEPAAGLSVPLHFPFIWELSVTVRLGAGGRTISMHCLLVSLEPVLGCFTSDVLFIDKAIIVFGPINHYKS